jgi:hypothetical protein
LGGTCFEVEHFSGEAGVEAVDLGAKEEGAVLRRVRREEGRREEEGGKRGGGRREESR